MSVGKVMIDQVEYQTRTRPFSAWGRGAVVALLLLLANGPGFAQQARL